MMENMKAKALRFKNHVVRQRYAYGYAALAGLAVATVVRNQKAFNEFLNEKGIDPVEFFAPEYFEEMNK